jgi:tetratricopeptide (TPR) repeat protein
MADFDKLWNYQDPAATEVKFREVLAGASAEKDLSYYLQLLTQIARTNSLRRKFTEAHELLDTVEKQLPVALDAAHVRYHLERGRTFNSSGKKADAQQNFEKAGAAARELKLDGYTIDAIHMLAISAPPELAIKLTEEALLFAEQSADDHAKRWLGTLYNNLGWSYFDNGDYEKALNIFYRTRDYYEQIQRPDETFIAKWCIARTLRALNENDKALALQLALHEEIVNTGKDTDGYVYEELGELFLIKGDQQKSATHFSTALELLSQDVNFVHSQAARLERIKTLANGGGLSPG